VGTRASNGVGKRGLQALKSAFSYTRGIVTDVLSGWHRHRCSQLGAAIAFYAIFAFVPLLLILASVFGFVLALWEGSASFKDSLVRLISEAVSPQVGRLAAGALGATQDARGELGILGLGALFLSATGAFAQLETAVQVVWDTYVSPDPVPFRIQVRNFLRTRLVSFLLAVGVGMVVLFSLVGEVLLDALSENVRLTTNEVMQFLNLGGGFVAAAVFVTILYRWLPRRRVPWRAALTGGVMTAFLWEVAKNLLSAYLTRRDYTNAYPLLGSALALLVWVYVAALVFLLGAEVAASITGREAARRNARSAASG
jgi:membrane protein